MVLINQEFWPEELWAVLRELWEQSRRPDRSRTPQVRITAGKCPDYVSPTGATREEFNTAVRALADAGIVRAEWQRNASPFILRIRLGEEQAPVLEALLGEFGRLPVIKEHADLAGLGLSVQAARERYGTLGLKTLSQIVTGDSKRLSESLLTGAGIDKNAYWVQPDAITVGASVVRIAGRVELRGPAVEIHPTWQPPGHYLWDWEIPSLTVEQVGERLLLIENPYPMWELMRRFPNAPVTLACIHGETQFLAGQNSALALFLERVFTRFRNLETLIWCDPDPGGLQIAVNAYVLVKGLGGNPRFWQMDEQVLDRLEELVIAKDRLQTLDDERRVLLAQMELGAELEPLRQTILARGMYGEQEALVCSIAEFAARLL